jgi:hypothetical protein
MPEPLQHLTLRSYLCYPLCDVYMSLLKTPVDSLFVNANQVDDQVRPSYGFSDLVVISNVELFVLHNLQTNV